MKFFPFVFCMMLCMQVFGQQAEDSLKASVPFEVTVRAYEQNRRLIDVPAGVVIAGKNELNRYNNTSLVQTLNAMPGIKMEERSPGSYRINIRGSSLRSPFGVRNVKIYYNDFPLTDPGGNTYLNQLGFYNIQSLELVKGPGSSLYGAGTGGVMLIQSLPSVKEAGIKVDQSFGSYGLSNSNINLTLGNSDHFNSVSYQRLSSDGYRNQSQVKRQVLAWDAVSKSNNNELSAHLLYSNLYYQTPGALTLAELTKDPRASRPRAGVAPGAAEAQAAIYLHSFFAGAGYKQVFNDHWQHNITLYGAFAELKNPAIRNYGRNAEPHFGGRTILQYTSTEVNGSKWDWNFGAEAQQAFNTVQVFNNKGGRQDSLLTNDEINNNQNFIFTQLSYQVHRWIITGGLSLNNSKVNLSRTSNVPSTSFTRKFKNQLAPRLALLNKLTDNISVYGSFAKGFSPPTVSELSPSGSAINSNLNAETGYNFEMGTRGSALQNKLLWDVNAFYYSLTNTIVQRRDALGGDYFTNAGSTSQKGLESSIAYRPFKQSISPNSKIWVSHTWYHFRYKEFKQLNNDFTGKSLPGIAPHFVMAGLDVYSKNGLYTNITYQYSGGIALNDANTDYATSYNLLGVRAGFKKVLHHLCNN